jgi:hypothetical protein
MNVEVREISDSATRRAACRLGYVVRKSRWRKYSIDNHGDFMIIEPFTNVQVARYRYDMSAREVVDWCRNTNLTTARCDPGAAFGRRFRRCPPFKMQRWRRHCPKQTSARTQWNRASHLRTRGADLVLLAKNVDTGRRRGAIRIFTGTSTALEHLAAIVTKS